MTYVNEKSFTIKNPFLNYYMTITSLFLYEEALLNEICFQINKNKNDEKISISNGIKKKYK